MSKSLKIIIPVLLVLVVGGAGAGYYYWQYTKNHRKEPLPQQQVNNKTQENNNSTEPLEDYNKIEIINNNLPQLVYKEDGKLYRTDVKGSFHQEIYKIWDEMESPRIHFIDFPDNSNKILVQVGGEENVEVNNQMNDIYNAKRLSLIDLSDNSITDIIPAPQIKTDSIVTHYLASNGNYLYSAEYYSPFPFEEYESRLLYPEVIIHIYDLDKKEWRLISNEMTLNRCGRNLVKDPWGRDDKWHVIFNFDWHYIKIVEDELVKKCNFIDESKENILSLSTLCPDEIVEYLSPSVYNQNYFIFSCGFNDSFISASRIGIYNMNDKSIIQIAKFNNPNGQVLGFYEANRYLLSPNQKKFIYGYLINNEKYILFDLETKKETILVDRTNDTRFISPYLFRIFSPSSDYILMTEETDDRFILKSYNIENKSDYEILSMKEFPDSENNFFSNSSIFIGWAK